jgi:signal transduction histidine kinase
MKNYRLLIVVDHIERARPLRAVFSSAGSPFDVEILRSAEQCFQALATARFDALLLDGEPARLNALELLHKMNAQGLAIPAILLIGPRHESLTKLAMAAGAEACVENESAVFKMLPRFVEIAIEKHRLKLQLAAYERQLIQNEKLAMVGLLASGVAHDLRNPLNTIETVRYYLSDLPQLRDARLQENLDIIQKNVQRASNIITNLLEFSRYSKHAREAIDINKLLDSTLLLFGKELAAKNIEVVTHYQRIPVVVLNLDALKQVFLNLVMNAAQAMPEGGRLTISTVAGDGENVQVTIADTGTGISKENLQHIFSPFFTTKAAGEGTGLGLYLSKLIIEREGGKISVESELSKGSVFFVLLPVVEEKSSG